MNADHDFQIGKDHLVCQDYALSGATEKIAYAIVCDGCSASPDVDFGARALALAARETLRVAKDTDMDYRNFGLTAIRRADTAKALFPTLHPQFLDSTLLIAWVMNNKLTAFMFGDGVFFHKNGESIRAVHVEFAIPKDGVDKPAPDYLSYELEPERKENYIELGGIKKVYDCISTGSPDTSGSEKPLRTFDPVVIQAPVAEGDVIALCSDGIGSFKEGGVREIPWQEMAREFTAFKTYKGVFVRRRFQFLKRDCAKKQWAHGDDISMAAIVV